jgi:hypothetical protein
VWSPLAQEATATELCLKPLCRSLNPLFPLRKSPEVAVPRRRQVT